MLDPTGNPIWSAYLARGHFFDQTFAALRPWYAIAAKSAAGRHSSVRDRTWEPERHLVEHAMIAIVRGKARVGETDAFVENAVNNVPVDDRPTHTGAFFAGGPTRKRRGCKLSPPISPDRLIHFGIGESTSLSDMKIGPIAMRKRTGCFGFALHRFSRRRRLFDWERGLSP